MDRAARLAGLANDRVAGPLNGGPRACSGCLCPARGGGLARPVAVRARARFRLDLLRTAGAATPARAGLPDGAVFWRHLGADHRVWRLCRDLRTGSRAGPDWRRGPPPGGRPGGSAPVFALWA